MLADAVAGLLQRGLRGWNMPESVQKPEIVDPSVITHGCYIDAGFLQFASISLAFISQRIVLRGDNQRGSTPLS